MKKGFSLLFIIFIFACTTSEKIYKLDNETLLLKQSYDIESINLCRNGLKKLTGYMDAHREIFPVKKLKKSKMLMSDQRETALVTWKAALDYFFALDSILAYHKDFILIKDPKLKSRSFYISAYSFTTEYSYALEIISRFENNPHFDIILNEPLENMDLPGGMYDSFKLRFLNVKTSALLAGYDAGFKLYKSDNTEISENISSDRNFIINKSGYELPIMTVENGINIIKTTGDKLIFPVQKGVSTFMGDTKVYRKHKSLITKKQVNSILQVLKPGDIILERREWYLTNIGIPGFWTHAALYVGTKEERESFFNDTSVLSWMQKLNYRNFEDYLKKNLGEKYTSFNTYDDQKHQIRIIEAVGEGVIFTSLEHSAYCDSIAVLRPRLSPAEKASAIYTAFKYAGKPYDFDFNFESDSAIVCTELIYKSYEKKQDFTGLSLPLENILGRKLLPANNFAKIFDSEMNQGSSQFEFILFYDGNEKEKKAFPSSLQEFRKTWERPKWHILMQ